MDFLLDPLTHDLKLEEGNTLSVENQAGLAQRLKVRLLLHKGTWFRDISEGVPYGNILGRSYSKEYADTSIKSRILATEGVLTLDEYTSTLQDNNFRVIFKVNNSANSIILEI